MDASRREPDSWRKRLAARRAEQFVGRESELSLWREALEAEQPPFAVLWLVGPGGIGKSTLLARLCDVAREFGASPIQLDARAFVGSEASFLEMLAGEMRTTVSGLDAALEAGPRKVLVIDTAEDLGELEAWLRDRFLPGLPAHCLVAIAGRRAPEGAWRSDAAWAGLLRVVGLRNLSREDSRRLLAVRGVDLNRYPRLFPETHGHPLSLALIADVLNQDPDAGAIDLRSHPDVVPALLARFVHDAPDDDHRRALAIAAHVRVTNEGVLRHGLGLEDAQAIFDWLASQSFVVLHTEGLYLHDLAAHAIDADHRRRDPDGYGYLHRRLRTPTVERLRTREGAEQYRAAMDLSWMHRFSAIMGALIDWEGARTLRPSPLEPADEPAVVEATRRFEGARAAELIEHWIRHRPQAFTMVRASPTRTLGYVCAVVASGRELDDPVFTADPRLVALAAHARTVRPLLPDDRVELAIWLAYDTHVDPSAVVSQVSICNIRSWFGSPGLTWGGFALPSRHDVWAPLMAYLDHHPAGEVRVDDTRYALFVHDWRAVTPTAFLDMMAEREISSAVDGGALPPPRELLALSHDEFVSLVKRALRDYCDDDALAANPLSRCRVALEVPDPGAAPLRCAIETAASLLTRSGRDELPHGALKLTYLDPARTQEEAAELLGVPFSTYRRHLATGVDRVTAWLWERDLHGYALPGPER